MLVKIQRMWLREGLSIREVAKRTGLSRNRAEVVASEGRNRTEVHGAAVAQQRRCLGRVS